jgi:hypothetical protein
MGRISASLCCHSLRVTVFRSVVRTQPEVVEQECELGVDCHQLPDDAIQSLSVENGFRPATPHRMSVPA